jgi:hypothetical protein
MRLKVISVAVCLLLPLAIAAQQRGGATYSWVDDEGIRHYGDRIPAEYADMPKQVVNEHGVTIGHIEGRKTAEQLEAERVAKELETQRELQRRADLALLSTYISVKEIEMHRDRRIELFQAQARVTELYLRNLRRRLDQLKGEAGRFKPYSSDPKAETVDPDLIEEIKETESSIGRHVNNLTKFRADEKQINERFEGDIQRFMILKGLTHAQAVPE